MPSSEQVLRVLSDAVSESCEVKRRTIETCGPVIVQIVGVLTTALASGHKLLLFGNGGSAADAQHVAGEFVGRFLKERRALPAIALNTDTAVLTCVGNDYSFENVFARQVEALARPGDVVVGISTSGSSPNVLRGIEAARSLEVMTVGFTGESGGSLRETADLCLCIPSRVTARVQEAHITVWHVICELVEQRLFGDSVS